MNAADDAILAAIGKNDKDYRDGFSLQNSASYDVNDKLKLMAGTYFYWWVIPKDHWIPAIPDGNRLAFSLGASYKILKYLTCDMSIIQVIGFPRKISNDISASVPLTGNVDGTYTTSITEVSVGATYHWDGFIDRITGKKAEAEVTKKPAR